MKRNEKNVSESTKKKLIDDVSNENYANPVIPKGYKHICGEWNNGFVIERNSDGSQFVWIPVMSLDSNGILPKNLANQKFGRRNVEERYTFSKEGYHERMTGELRAQVESVKKYGGFYISRYKISENKQIKNRQSDESYMIEEDIESFGEYEKLFEEHEKEFERDIYLEIEMLKKIKKAGKPQSVKTTRYWTNVTFDEAQLIAMEFEKSDEVKSHLPYGSEYDSMSEWFRKSGAQEKMCKKYKSNRKADKREKWQEWSINNICGLLNEVEEWSQEKYGRYWRAVRVGGHPEFSEIVLRSDADPIFQFMLLGFRIVLCIE